MPYKNPEDKKEQLKRYYLSHKDKYIRSRKDQRDKKRKYLINLKESSPCVDCGKYYPYYVMDFDHLRDKKKALAAISFYSWKTLLKEVEKCEIVCANCHRIRTFKRKEN